MEPGQLRRRTGRRRSWSITSEKDFRIPYTQGIAAFTALQRRNIPSRLLIFPDENHWVLKPKNSVQWYDEVFGWMGRYLGGSAPVSRRSRRVEPARSLRGRLASATS